VPFDAFGSSLNGYDYEAILQRAALMPKEKAKRFTADGYQRWLREDQTFLARALTDTAYLSRIAKEYLSLICPANQVRVIPGRLTAMLRGKFGLNQLLSGSSEKNRNDHRHHAVDAAVIGVTDQGLLARFAKASADARGLQLTRLVENMPLPWDTYRDHVERAIGNVIVSHKPDHGHEGALHNDTAYGMRADGEVVHRVMLDGFKSAVEIEKVEFADETAKQWLLDRTAGLSGKEFAERLSELQREHGLRGARVVEKLSVIGIRSVNAAERHGYDDDGESLAYKGYKGDSNYCIEIYRSDKGKWASDVISTYRAHQIVREHGMDRLRHKSAAQNGESLVMRLVIGDVVKAEFKGTTRLLQVKKIRTNGALFVTALNEANVRKRHDAKDPTLIYGSFSAGTMQKAAGRMVTVSEIGDARDRGFIA
jgi:CRISPR-associated endonuclease Csn1